jgi:hypothetical protein
MAALHTVLSLDGRDLATSRRHLWRVRGDASALVVHTSKNPVGKVLPWRTMYWVGHNRGRSLTTGDRAHG